jgi:hypothetical protein
MNCLSQLPMRRPLLTINLGRLVAQQQAGLRLIGFYTNNHTLQA